MKKILKNNWLILSIYFIVFLFIINAVNTFVNNNKKAETMRTQFIAECKDNLINSKDENYVQYCNRIIESENVKIDFFTMLTDLIVFDLRFLNATAFIILIIPALFSICKILKNKHVIYYITRKNYQQFIGMLMKKAYKNLWLLPLIALTLIFFVKCNTTFDSTFAINNSSSMWSSATMRNPIIFIICYMSNIVLYSFSFINLALIVARKHHNIVSAIILSIMTYIGIQLFFEVVVNAIICQMLLHTEIGYLFNIMNLFTFSDQYGITVLLLFTLSIFVLTSIGVYFSYKNKEKFIIDCEKNN